MYQLRTALGGVGMGRREESTRRNCGTGGGGPVHHSVGLCGYDYVLDVDDDDVVLAGKVGAVVVGGVAVDEPAPVHPHKDGQRAVRCEAVTHTHTHTQIHTHTYIAQTWCCFERALIAHAMNAQGC